MALSNKSFKGAIGGKNIWSYSYGLDYKLESLEDRKKLVEDLLNIVSINGIEFSNDEFWQEIWDMAMCKSNPTTSDPLWSETNVCLFLEKVGTYLISKDGKKRDKENIKVYDSYSEFKRIMQQEKKIKRHGEVVEFDLGESEEGQGKPIIMLKNQKNYKKAPDIKITKKDMDKYPEIKDYHMYKEYLLSLRDDKKKREELANRINIDTKNFKMKSQGDVYRFACKQLPKVEDDMLQVKILKDKNIVWKSPLKDSCNSPIIDSEFIDFLDKTHVRALLQIPNRDIIDEINICKNDILNKIKFTDAQEVILDLWEKGVTQEEISNRLNIAQSSVSSQLDRIVNNFINKYIEVYEYEYYYMYLVKGQYKKCNKCGEILLIQRFDKKNDNKDGYKNNCKSCR